ncbi:MAG: outer membrane protein assembly factor BamD [Polyangia bacterium]
MAVARRLGLSPPRLSPGVSLSRASRASRAGRAGRASRGLTARLALSVALAVPVAGLALTQSGCAQFVENFRPVLFAKKAKENYERGVRSMKGESHLDAEKYFRYVIQNWPTSRWAAWAELGLADAAFGKEDFIGAIEAYKVFMAQHPRHEKKVDGYCAYRIGEAYYKQIPSDWFLVPPSYEKDQGPVIDAQRELTDFLDRYGRTVYADSANKLLAEVIQRLVDHELYVARFYLDRNRPRAAICRLEYVVENYPRAKRDAEVLLVLGEVYLKQATRAEELLGTGEPLYAMARAELLDYRCKGDEGKGGKKEDDDEELIRPEAPPTAEAKPESEEPAEAGAAQSAAPAQAATPKPGDKEAKVLSKEEQQKRLREMLRGLVLNARDAFLRITIEHKKDFRAQQARLYLQFIEQRYRDLPEPRPLQERRKQKPVAPAPVGDELAPMPED